MHAGNSQQHQKDKTRELQRKLYLAAKRTRNRRFHALYDRIYRLDILWRAWKEVKEQGGVAGVDKESIEDIKQQGEETFLERIQKELKEGIYRAKAVKRVYIPKSDGSRRPLGIPTIKDRVVQQACRIVIEPIFEADFQECSYGFRPKRSAVEAAEGVKDKLVRKWWVIDADIEKYFDEIDHQILMRLIEKRISDRRVQKLIRKWLKVGISEEGVVRTSERGTPQGGVISPLLANIYLDVFDRYWKNYGSRYGELLRYADDFVILCESRQRAERGYKVTQQILRKLKLKLQEEKTKIVNMNEEGFEFLGYYYRKYKSRISGRIRPAMWPSKRSMKNARQSIKECTTRKWERLSLKSRIETLNPKIRGWRNYFSSGNSTKKLQDLDKYVIRRLWHFYRGKCKCSGSQLLEKYKKQLEECGLERYYRPGKCGDRFYKAQEERCTKAV